MNAKAQGTKNMKPVIEIVRNARKGATCTSSTNNFIRCTRDAPMSAPTVVRNVTQLEIAMRRWAIT